MASDVFLSFIMSNPVQYTPSIQQGIYATPAAEQRILAYLEEHHHQHLRLSVKKTGCSGYSYVMDYVQTPNPDDLIFPLQADRFICVEKASYPFLKGVTMDYVKQGIQAKFVFNNPNQAGECGCGESFSIKD